VFWREIISLITQNGRGIFTGLCKRAKTGCKRSEGALTRKNIVVPCGAQFDLQQSGTSP